MRRLFEPWRLDDTELDMPDAAPHADWLWKRVTAPTPEIAAHVFRGGLCLVDFDDNDAAFFAEATAVIAKAPSLAKVVFDRVGAVHVLHAQPGYDVSHSEPVWASRIFVSLPERRDRVGALRLAESLIHEAMHLHLTLREKVCPLVCDLGGQAYSPWRQTQRSYGGVLHGLFVFVSLAAFFAGLREEPGVAEVYLRKRMAEIAEDLASVDRESLESGLTNAGRQLVVALMKSVRLARLRRHAPKSQ